MELLKSICSSKLLKKADLLTWWAVKLLPSMTRITILGRHSCPRWLYLVIQWRPVKVWNVGCLFPQGHCLHRCTCVLKMVPDVRESTNKWVCLRKIKICGGLVTQSCPTVAAPGTVACQAPLSMGFSRQEIGVGCHFLLQGIFLIHEWKPGLLHCRQILYQLSYKGSPKDL